MAFQQHSKEAGLLTWSARPRQKLIWLPNLRAAAKSLAFFEEAKARNAAGQKAVDPDQCQTLPGAPSVSAMETPLHIIAIFVSFLLAAPSCGILPKRALLKRPH